MKLIPSKMNHILSNLTQDSGACLVPVLDKIKISANKCFTDCAFKPANVNTERVQMRLKIGRQHLSDLENVKMHSINSDKLS